MSENYFRTIEQKWQKVWSEQELFTVKNEDKPKFYCLEMFPYPSGILHMGHMRNYCIGDTVAWYKRLRDFSVLHPIGWDSFGQPAEQAAIKNQVQPCAWTEKNIEHMKGQLKRLGISYDWNREIATHKPEYYRWNQWFFLQLFKRKLVYRRKSSVNWCPKEETVLSNEQAAEGKCWRCKSNVIEKDLEQWFIKITDYADELLGDLEELKDTWPAKVLKMQQNWIGRSEKSDGNGKQEIHYNLHDWGISRQRFWGTPIPIVYCELCGVVALEEKDLPVVLPEKAEFTGIGESPLAKISEFVNTTCPKCSKSAKRETDTMDTFIDSAWYYFRYCDPKNTQMPFDKGEAAKYLPVDLYIGGIDNAVMHLLYTRFWSKVARDMGLVFFDEPIKSLLTQGMVLGEVKSCLKPNSWSAMSKTLGNGVDPDQIIEKYGVDPVRLFVLFAAPPEQELRWSEKGIEGTIRFLHKVRDLIDAWAVIFTEVSENSLEKNTKTAKKIRYLTHKSIAKITYDMERFHFNTCISTLMEFVNGLCEIDIMIVREDISVKFAIKEALEALITMLTPFAPHFAEEMWHTLGNKKNILSSCVEWPKYETKLIENQVINLAVQINGKLCTRISTDVNYSREEIEALVLADKKVIARVKSKNITRIVFVPNHLINLVLS